MQSALTSPGLERPSHHSEGKPRPHTDQPLSVEDIASFHRDGYVMLPGFFTSAEIDPLREALLADPTVGGRIRGVMDSDGFTQEILGWSTYSDTWLGKAAYLARFVDNAATLLGGPVYHWHSKLSMKRPGAAGKWDWHQDYPYWYKEGALWPDMLTASIAVDPMNEENGCLKLVRGSHRLGRIDHGQFGHAIAIDPERLPLILDQLPVDSIVLAPGDAVFFHGNVLHASGPNTSTTRPRTILHCSYNTIVNSPFIAEGQEHHLYRPFDVVPDDALRARDYVDVFASHDWSRRGRSNYGYKSVQTM